MYMINTDKMNQIMVKRHWCAADIAALTGMRHKTVSDILKEKKKQRIYLDTAMKLANVLEIPIQNLIIEV